MCKGGIEAIDCIKGYSFENTISLCIASNCFLNNLKVFCMYSVGKMSGSVSLSQYSGDQIVQSEEVREN